MARTKISRTLIRNDAIGNIEIENGSIQREDLNTDITGHAVVTRIAAGTNVTISSTGADTGTGVVTINAAGGGGGSSAVTRIIAGTNVTISSTGTDGIGDVTINATSGGGGSATPTNAMSLFFVDLATSAELKAGDGTQFNYNNGENGIGATLFSLGEVGPTIGGGIISGTVINGTIILVKDQPDAATNGIYEASFSGYDNSLILTRLDLFDEQSEVRPGTLVYVGDGFNASNTYILLGNGTFNIGTDLLIFNLQSSIPNIRYDITGGFFGKPASGATVHRFKVPSDLNRSLPANLDGSVVDIGTAPTAVTILEILGNGINIGTIEIYPDSSYIFNFSNETPLTAGMLLSIVNQTPADNTLADVTWTLVTV
jgi:hypothetical protein